MFGYCIYGKISCETGWKSSNFEIFLFFNKGWIVNMNRCLCTMYYLAIRRFPNQLPDLVVCLFTIVGVSLFLRRTEFVKCKQFGVYIASIKLQLEIIICFFSTGAICLHFTNSAFLKKKKNETMCIWRIFFWPCCSIEKPAIVWIADYLFESAVH